VIVPQSEEKAPVKDEEEGQDEGCDRTSKDEEFSSGKVKGVK